MCGVRAAHLIWLLISSATSSLIHPILPSLFSFFSLSFMCIIFYQCWESVCTRIYSLEYLLLDALEFSTYVLQPYAFLEGFLKEYIYAPHYHPKGERSKGEYIISFFSFVCLINCLIVFVLTKCVMLSSCPVCISFSIPFLFCR